MRHAETLRDQVEQDIVTGHFKPGDRLDEQSLADRFGVSRTPIREAFMQLASTGMIELHPGRGAFVARLGLKDILERLEVMASLEGLCGSLAARRISEPERSSLVSTHEACKAEAEAGSIDRYYYANENFHNQIYDACHNRYLTEQARQLHRRLKPYRRLQLRARHRVAASLAEHQRIVDAILSGDAILAESELRAHILIQGDRLADFIQTFEG